MNERSVDDIYKRLLGEISSLYTRTRQAVVSLYWEIGKQIVEVEQKGVFRGEYGDYLIHRLSRDLTGKFGKGFSPTNLRSMRKFYRTYSIQQLSVELEWSSYVALLSVRDGKERELLEKRAIEEGLNPTQLKRIVRSEFRERGKPGPETAFPEAVRGRLHLYSPVEPGTLPREENTLLVDCGFNIWREVPVKETEAFSGGGYISSVKKRESYVIKPEMDLSPDLLYTYKATVEKVVDGDTLWTVIHCGFGSYTRQKLRLRNIDTPELDTEEGRRAKAFVERRLKGLSFVVVKTYKSDKYDRYLTDLFYLPGVDDPEKVAAEGKLLNRELVEKGLGVLVC